MPYITPDDLPESGIVCEKILRVPDTEQWMAIVSGALLVLAEEWNWEQETGISVETAALRAREMIEDWWSQTCEVQTAMSIGTIVAYVTAAPPPGVLAADGATYNRVDYPDLYGLLDSFYILNENQFVVPDLRGRTLVGVGQGAGLTNRVVGETGGEETHVLAFEEMPSHRHTARGANEVNDSRFPSGRLWAQNDVGQESYKTNPTSIVNMFADSMTYAGGDEPHENMPPYASVRYGIVAE